MSTSGTTALVLPCWRRAFRVATAPLDYETLAGTVGGPAQLQQLQVAVADTFTLDTAAARSPLRYGGTSAWVLNLAVTDADDAPIVGFAPSPSSPFYTNREVVFDEWSNAKPSGYAAAIAVWDDDAVDHSRHSVKIVGLSPPEGSPLLNGLRAADVFNMSLLSLPATGGAGSGNVTGGRYSTFDVIATTRLERLQAKQFSLRLEVTTPYRGSAAAVSTMPLTVRVIRSNQPVTFAAGNGTVLNVTENSPIGTIIGELAASDADSHQSLRYSILSSTASIPDLFALRHWNASGSCFDPAANRTINTAISRSASLIVNRDALDYDAAISDRTITLTIAVEDDGAVCNSGLLPAAEPTRVVLVVTVQVTDAADTPSVTAVRFLPAAGLSVAGGQVIELIGTGLGLPDPASPASNVTVTYADARTGQSYAMTSCRVAQRLTRVQCLTSPGFGQGLQMTLSLPGQPPVAVPAIAVGYQLPQALRVAPYGSTGIGGSDITSLSTIGSGRFYVYGSGITAAAGVADSDYYITLVGGRRNRLVVPGCVRVVPPPFSDSGLVQEPYLNCSIPEGAGAGLAVQVALYNATAFPPTLSYAPPAVTSISVTPPDVLTITGTNLGNASFLEWVRYASQAPYFSQCDSVAAGGCEPLSQSACSSKASCRVHQASACTFLANHTSIRCVLDPLGWGEDFRLQVSVAGQLSQWSTTSFSYPAPAITEPLQVVPASNDVLPTISLLEGLKYATKLGVGLQAGSVVTDAVTQGGSLIAIIGTGFSLGFQSEITLTIGGVQVPIESIVRNGSSTYRLTAFAPEGFGRVTVRLRVGDREAVSWLQYQPIELRDGLKGTGTPQDPKFFRVIGKGLSRCAYVLCYGARPDYEPCGSLERCALPDEFAGGSRLPGAGAGSPNCLRAFLNGTAVGKLFVPECPYNLLATKRDCPLPPITINGTDRQRDDSFCIGTGLKDGMLNISLAGANSSYLYDLTKLVDVQPTVTALEVVTPSRAHEVGEKKWLTAGGDVLLLSAVDAGEDGSVIITGQNPPVTFFCPSVSELCMAGSYCTMMIPSRLSAAYPSPAPALAYPLCRRSGTLCATGPVTDGQSPSPPRPTC